MQRFFDNDKYWSLREESVNCQWTDPDKHNRLEREMRDMWINWHNETIDAISNILKVRPSYDPATALIEEIAQTLDKDNKLHLWWEKPKIKTIMRDDGVEVKTSLWKCVEFIHHPPKKSTWKTRKR